jgi:hypothetical protein
MKKMFIFFLIILFQTASYAEYMKLTSDQKNKWIKPRETATLEKAAAKNTIADYLGKITQDKLGYIKKYGSPDIIGRWNIVSDPGHKRIEEWVYYASAKYIYFDEESGNLLREEKLTELDKLSMDGKVEVGMDKDQVRRAIGEPAHVDIKTDKYGADEKWTYGSMYVWFKEGKVTRRQR